MKISFSDRFGNEVNFERKERKFFQLPGETFTTALVRTYYPKDYERHQKMRMEMIEETCE